MTPPPIRVFDDFLLKEELVGIRKLLMRGCKYTSLAFNNWTGDDYWHPLDGGVMKAPRWSTHPGEPSFPHEVTHLFDKAMLVTAPYLIPGQLHYHLTMTPFAYPAGAGMPWHDDGNAVCSFIYYVSPWLMDWGGELMLRTDLNQGEYLAPVPNRFVVVGKGVKHKVNPVNFRAGAEVRFSIAGFLTERK